ncbi:MAG: AraC family transcriptional regulator [Anaerocolumna sp.]|nr:AraC family transcriptional regulator [Anaerocolumna sp.]
MEQNYYIEKRDTYNDLPLQFSLHMQVLNGIGEMAHAHMHDYIEILYALSGKYQILLNNRDYTFKEGDMVLINSNEIHNVFSESEGLNRYICIKFEPELLYTSWSLIEMKYLMPFILKDSSHQKIFTREEIATTVVPSPLTDMSSQSVQISFVYSCIL